MCTGPNCTYSPDAHYFGSDSFTFKANDSALDSNVSTVSVTVTEINNDPSAVKDNKETAEDSSLNFPSSDLTSNDSAGPGEGAQTLTVDSVISIVNTHGSVNLSAGQITYTPDANYNGPASFDYHMCDDGTTDGAPDPKCATGTVNVTVSPVNDAPVLMSSVGISLITSTNSNLVNVGLAASATDYEGEQVTIQVAVFGDEDDQTPTFNNVLHSPDAKDIAPGTLRLRGERIEANDGRVYLIVITATDSSGNIGRNYQTVVVPKNNKQASLDSVNAQAAAAITYAQTHGGAAPAGYFVIGDGPMIGPKQ